MKSIADFNAGLKKLKKFSRLEIFKEQFEHLDRQARGELPSSTQIQLPDKSIIAELLNEIIPILESFRTCAESAVPGIVELYQEHQYFLISLCQIVNFLRSRLNFGEKIADLPQFQITYTATDEADFEDALNDLNAECDNAESRWNPDSLSVKDREEMQQAMALDIPIRFKISSESEKPALTITRDITQALRFLLKAKFFTENRFPKLSMQLKTGEVLKIIPLTKPVASIKLSFILSPKKITEPVRKEPKEKKEREEQKENFDLYNRYRNGLGSPLITPQPLNKGLSKVKESKDLRKGKG